ncbi:unnamed protein product, partial [Discosporangium mesarthrocarpum]
RGKACRGYLSLKSVTVRCGDDVSRTWGHADWPQAFPWRCAWYAAQKHPGGWWRRRKETRGMLYVHLFIVGQLAPFFLFPLPVCTPSRPWHTQGPLPTRRERLFFFGGRFYLFWNRKEKLFFFWLGGLGWMFSGCVSLGSLIWSIGPGAMAGGTATSTGV